ncbi:MAG TPA: hypothetical protein PLL71_01795 [Agriterribacter sp.]|nr:hypothetical protein [Agriterribacter sp.]HRQ49014.1 hypothetical protein [Agriterribacter sp.]
MTRQNTIPCTHCNLTNQHLCIYCKGTGRIPVGGGGLQWIIALLILVPVAIISAVSSLFISLILKMYVNSIEPESPKLQFGKAFNLILKTTFLYQLLNGVISLIIYLFWKQNGEISFFNIGPTDQSDIYELVLTLFLFCQVPTILITGILLQSRLLHYLKFKKFPGYLRSALFTGIVIMPLILATSYVVMKIVNVYFFKQPII